MSIIPPVLYIAESRLVSLTAAKGTCAPKRFVAARIMVESLRCITPNPASSSSSSCCRVDVLSDMVCFLLFLLVLVLWLQSLQCPKRQPRHQPCQRKRLCKTAFALSADTPTSFIHACNQAILHPSCISLRLRLFWREHGRAEMQARISLSLSRLL